MIVTSTLLTALASPPGLKLTCGSSAPPPKSAVDMQWALQEVFAPGKPYVGPGSVPPLMSDSDILCPHVLATSLLAWVCSCPHPPACLRGTRPPKRCTQPCGLLGLRLSKWWLLLLLGPYIWWLLLSLMQEGRALWLG